MSTNSNITRSDVISYLADLNPDEVLIILNAARPDELDVSEGESHIWNSYISVHDMTKEDIFLENNDGDNTDSDLVDLPEWLNQAKPHHVQFYKDMVNAGFEDDVRHYRGRFYYDGPGVTVSHYNMDDVIRSTKVSLQRDNMGLDMILYPNS
jgi:hypothetical protein